MSRPFTRSQAKRPLSPSAAAASAAPSASAQRARVESQRNASSSSRPQSTTALRPPSIAQRCHTDALHCILAFLDFEDLPRFVLTCRAWQAAAMKEKSRGLYIQTSQRPSIVDELVSSSLIRLHAVGLVMKHEPITAQLRMVPHEYVPLSARQLMRISQNLVHLTCLDLQVQLSLKGDEAPSREEFVQHALSPHLSEMAVYCHDDESIRLLLDALPAATSLQALDLEYFLKNAASVDLSSLTRLPSLTQIELNWKPSDEQCTALKQLSALKLLCLTNDCSKKSIAVLCLHPHSLQQLEDLRVLGTDMSASVAKSLSHLPSLTSLQPNAIDPDAFPLLPRLTSLRSLRECTLPRQLDEVSSLAAGLRPLAHLTQLGLNDHNFGYLRPDVAPVLQTVLRAVPQLQSLLLGYMRIQTLSFLSELAGLQSLSLTLVTGFPPNDLLQFTAQLRSLHVAVNDPDQLSLALRAQLHPPSTVLPKLQEFEYDAHTHVCKIRKSG